MADVLTRPSDDRVALGQALGQRARPGLVEGVKSAMRDPGTFVSEHPGEIMDTLSDVVSPLGMAGGVGGALVRKVPLDRADDLARLARKYPSSMARGVDPPEGLNVSRVTSEALGDARRNIQRAKEAQADQAAQAARQLDRDFPNVDDLIDQLDRIDNADLVVARVEGERLIEQFQRAKWWKKLPEVERSRIERGYKLGYRFPGLHGTGGNIDEFDPLKLGDVTAADTAREGFYFSSSPRTAEIFAEWNLQRNPKAADTDVPFMPQIDVTTDIMTQNLHADMRALHEQARRVGDLGGISSRTRKNLEKLDELSSIELKTSRQIKEFGKTHIHPAMDELLGDIEVHIRDLLDDLGHNRSQAPEKIDQIMELEDAYIRTHNTGVRLSDVHPGSKVLIRELVYTYNRQINDRIRHISKALSRRAKGADDIQRVAATVSELKKKAAEMKKNFQADIQPGAERLLSEATPVGPSIMPVALKMDNPYEYDFRGRGYNGREYLSHIRYAKENGFDGCVFRNSQNVEDVTDVYIVWDNKQIRSANATFDPDAHDSGDILASVAWPMGLVAGAEAYLANWEARKKRKKESQ
jgi:hypothetical protein